MGAIARTDPDYVLSSIPYERLIELQESAERHGFSTRWSSVAALRAQTTEGDVPLFSLLREMRHGSIRAYRCIFVARAVNGGGFSSTLDVAPEDYETLPRLERTSPAGGALEGLLWRLTVGGYEFETKG